MVKVVKLSNKDHWGLSVLASGLYKIMKYLNIFSETAGSIFHKIHMGPSVERILTICSNGSAPLNKMAAMPISGITRKSFFLSTKRTLRLNLGSIRDSRSTKFVKMITPE